MDFILSTPRGTRMDASTAETDTGAPSGAPKKRDFCSLPPSSQYEFGEAFVMPRYSLLANRKYGTLTVTVIYIMYDVRFTLVKMCMNICGRARLGVTNYHVPQLCQTQFLRGRVCTFGFVLHAPLRKLLN